MKMHGFRARKQKSGKTYYYFDAGGTPRKEIPLGPDYVAAVRKWTELSASQRDPAAAATFDKLADKYDLEVINLKAKSTQATNRGDLKMLRTFFCTPTPAPIEQIKPHHVHKLLQWKKATPTTANRLKRLFSHMWNMARAWGYTDLENPCTGIRGFELGRREVYVTDQVFAAIWSEAPAPLQDAMDLAYLTGQRPADTLGMTTDHIRDGVLHIRQSKTSAKLAVRIEGKLAELLQRIEQRKDGLKIASKHLTVNTFGRALSAATLRNQWEEAREAAAKANPKLAAEIRSVWFYDLRAKAADDVAERQGDQAAADLLGHETVATTRAHYLRKGKTVSPTR